MTHGICPRPAQPQLGDVLTAPLETKHFLYFYLGHCAILLFKTQ